MNFRTTINYESSEMENRYIHVSDDSCNARELAGKIRAAINAEPIYAPWNNIECSPIDTMTVDGIELDMILITPDKSAGAKK